MIAGANDRAPEAMHDARPMAPPLYAFVSGLSGVTQGFVTVTLGYVCARNGFTEAAIAAMIGLRLLPETWRLFFGPVLDLSLNPRLWYLISALCAAFLVALFAMIPLQPENAALLSLLALGVGIFANICIVAQAASIAVTTGMDVRGRIAGWAQAGNLGGVGLGGGLGLWLATHFGMDMAALAISACCFVCAWPMLVIRTPRPGRALPFFHVARGLGRSVIELGSTRTGMLTILAVTLPMGLGSFLGLLSSISGDWHAGADLTAATTGVLAGLASVPGCLIGGYLCDRAPPQVVLACSGLVCALGEVAMALGARTPVAFVAFTLLNNFLLGIAWAAVAAVIFVALRR